jgi:hypothetical protein
MADGNRNGLTNREARPDPTKIAKQNTTKSLSSRRMEYVSGVADRTPAAQNITSRFVGPRTFSARSAA